MLYEANGPHGLGSNRPNEPHGPHGPHVHPGGPIEPHGARVSHNGQHGPLVISRLAWSHMSHMAKMHNTVGLWMFVDVAGCFVGLVEFY